jgi:ribosomal protein S18 acetylase RimI-like enzyme
VIATTIRVARPEDAAAIARLHVTVWPDAYRALAPAEAVRILDEDYRCGRWQAMLSAPGKDQRVLLAEQDGRLAGIGATGAPSEPSFGQRGEIKSLYVDPAYKRQGVGRRLMRNLVMHLSECSYPGAALGVVDGNEPAMAFYRSLGGRVAGRYIDPGPIWRSANLVFLWDDLTPLQGCARN